MAGWGRIDSRRIDDLAYVVGLAIGAAVLLSSGFLDLSLSAIQQGDFVKFWAGPRALLMGEDPFDSSTWHDTAVRLGALRVDWPVYGYFGWATLLVLPFALLPLESAAAVWTIGGAALAAIAIRALLRAYLPGMPLAHTLVGIALLASHPSRLSFILGQWSFLLVASLAATILLTRAGREVPAALVSVVMLAKPQLFVLTGPAVATWAWLSGHRRFVVAAAIATAGLVLASVLVMPSWPGVWIREMPSATLFNPPRTTTPAAVLYELFGPPGTWLALGAMVLAAIVAFRFDPRSDQWLALWSCLSLAVAPYTWSYDQVLLLVPSVIGAGAIARRSRRAANALIAAATLTLLVLATLLGVVAAARNRESYSAVTPVIVFAILAGFLWMNRGQHASSSLAAGSAPGFAHLELDRKEKQRREHDL